MAKNQVEVTLTANVAQYNKAIETSNENTKKFVTETTGGMRQMTGVFTNFGYLAQDLPYAAQNFGSIANNINPAINAIMYMNQETGSLGATMAMIAKNMLSPVGLIFLFTSVLPSAIQIAMNHFNSLKKETDSYTKSIEESVKQIIKFTDNDIKVTFDIPDNYVDLNLELTRKLEEKYLSLNDASALLIGNSREYLALQKDANGIDSEAKDNAKAKLALFSNIKVLSEDEIKKEEQNIKNRNNELSIIKDIKLELQERSDKLASESRVARILIKDYGDVLKLNKELNEMGLSAFAGSLKITSKEAEKLKKILLEQQKEISEIIAEYGRFLEKQQKDDQDKALEAFDDYSEKYADKLNKIRDLDIELSGATTSEKIALKKQEIDEFKGSETEKLDLIIELRKLELQYETQLNKDKAELSKLQLEHDTKMSGNNLLMQVQLKGQELQNFKGSEEEKLKLKIEYMKLLNELDRQYLAETEKRNRELEINTQKMISNMTNQWSSLNRTIWDSTRTGKEKWDDMLNSMLIGLTEAIGQMIIQWALYDSAKSKAQGGSGDFASSGIISSVLGTIPVVGTFLAPIASALGFANGGYTGDGDPRKIAGVVHYGEHVINAEKTKKLERGVGYIDKAIEYMANANKSSINIQPIDYNKLALAISSQPPNVIIDGVDTNKSLDRSRAYDRRRF